MKSFAIFFLVVVVAAHAQAFMAQAAAGILTSQAKNKVVEVAVKVLTEHEKGQLSLAQKALTAAARTRCRWTEKMSQQEENEIRANRFENLSKKQQCFIKCVTDSFRFADVAVDLLAGNQTTFKKILDPLVNEDDAAVISAECNKLTGEDDCATSAAVFSCYVKYNATQLI